MQANYIIKNMLKWTGVTQREASKMLGVSESYFNQRLSRNYNLAQEMLDLICKLGFELQILKNGHRVDKEILTHYGPEVSSVNDGKRFSTNAAAVVCKSRTYCGFYMILYKSHTGGYFICHYDVKGERNFITICTEEEAEEFRKCA